jgi:alkylation response protein AidB-like acyl-CoA dehydrogenase
VAAALEARGAVRPTDFLELDRSLSDEGRDVRDPVSAFVADQVLPHVGKWFEEAGLPVELVPQLGKLGVLGMHLREQLYAPPPLLQRLVAAGLLGRKTGRGLYNYG